MERILVRLDLLPSLRSIPWVPHRQAPEHFMVELWKPRLVPSSLAEQEQASSECFLERNRVALHEIFGWCVPFFEEKVLPSGCSPRSSCYLEQGAGGSCLEIALILRRKAPEHIPGFFIKKNSDIDRSGFFCREALKWSVLKKSSW